VLVEEAPPSEPVAQSVERPRHLLSLSAKTEAALRELARRYQAHFLGSESASLADMCFTANAGRSHFRHRLAISANSLPEIASRLTAFVSGEAAPDLIRGEVIDDVPPKVAFLFTGQGAQYMGMGRELFETQPIFRQALERCAEGLRSHLQQPLLSVMFGAPGISSELLDQTVYTQPVLFALEWALAELLRNWGIQPSWVLGHSLGEYTAACVAGFFP